MVSGERIAGISTAFCPHHDMIARLSHDLQATGIELQVDRTARANLEPFLEHVQRTLAVACLGTAG